MIPKKPVPGLIGDGSRFSDKIMRNPEWLTARPIAHRGLHDASAGRIENTATAFSAAIAAGYGIECDLQVSADGEAMVYHDDALGRLTEGSAPLSELSADAIGKVRFKQSADRILTLHELCDVVAGRVTLLLELKSRFDGDLRLAARAAAVLAGYAGPVAVMSFDPQLVAALRRLAPALARGLTAQASHDDLPARYARPMARFLHVIRARPQFIAYRVADLPAPAPRVLRRLFGLPLLAWTVRTPEERARAAAYADQVIFEGWRP
jgi:glycerophosphoryl diester phosphodiesterase